MSVGFSSGSRSATAYIRKLGKRGRHILSGMNKPIRRVWVVSDTWVVDRFLEPVSDPGMVICQSLAALTRLVIYLRLSVAPDW